MSPISLEDSFSFKIGTSSATTGAATNADSTPTVAIDEDGVVMGYAPSVVNVSTGEYRVTVAVTAANGFEAGKRYCMAVSATVGGIAGKDGVGEFEVLAVDLNTGVASVTGAVGSVTGSVGSVVGLTAANLDVAVSTRMATYTQPTGFLAATFPATVASTTNITAGTITTTTNLTNLPSIPANWITTAGITDGAFTAAKFAAASLNGKGDWNIGKTGYSLTSPQTFDLTGNITGNLSGSVGSVTALSASAVDAIWDEVLDSGYTGRELVRGFASALMAKLSGAEVLAPVFRDVADTKDRITAVTDASGNRTAVTLDLT